MPRYRRWNERETLFALFLLLRTPYSKIRDDNPAIIDAARRIERSPAALKMKIFNLYSCLPQEAGLENSSVLDRQIMDAYLIDNDRIINESVHAAAHYLGNDSNWHVEVERLDLISSERTESRSWTVVRLKQDLFRGRLLDAYEGKCCVTGLERKELLIASHIKPWRAASGEERVDRRNGLLLNALHDRAFDKGLVTVTECFELRLSPALKKGEFSDSVVGEFFEAYEGQPIMLPENEHDQPQPELLRWHQQNVYRSTV